jgi:hypothetical protein
MSDKPADAKRYLRETLKMANAEDLNRNVGIGNHLLEVFFLEI